MSVAFRRESDEEHKEPSFERPLPPGPNWVTAAGLAQIERTLAEWTAKAGAAQDEADIAEAKRELHYWRTRHATALVQPVPGEDEVAFGSRVRFRLNGSERIVTLVGSDSADPAAGLIVFTAPLAQALIGLAPGETAEWQGRADAIEVLETGPAG